MELLKAFEKNCLTAAETAENTLMSLLRDNADTEYGKKYRFSHIDSVRAYKGTVPFTEYKDYSDSISRMMHGEKKHSDGLSPRVLFTHLGNCRSLKTDPRVRKSRKFNS